MPLRTLAKQHFQDMNERAGIRETPEAVTILRVMHAARRAIARMLTP